MLFALYFRLAIDETYHDFIHEMCVMRMREDCGQGLSMGHLDKLQYMKYT